MAQLCILTLGCILRWGHFVVPDRCLTDEVLTATAARRRRWSASDGRHQYLNTLFVRLTTAPIPRPSSRPQTGSGKEVTTAAAAAPKIRVAINGFGRIGRNFLRCWYGRGESSPFEVVAVNDSGGIKNAVHLLKCALNINTHNLLRSPPCYAALAVAKSAALVVVCKRATGIPPFAPRLKTWPSDHFL